jgi:hypothetical protein
LVGFTRQGSAALRGVEVQVAVDQWIRDGFDPKITMECETKFLTFIFGNLGDHVHGIFGGNCDAMGSLALDTSCLEKNVFHKQDNTELVQSWAQGERR